MKDEKPRGTLKLLGPKVEVSLRPASITSREPMRSNAKLEPLAKKVAENVSLMKKFHATVGAADEARMRSVIDEIREYATSIDPTLTYAEGAKLALLLRDYR
jgi:hypothetical protein